MFALKIIFVFVLINALQLQLVFSEAEKEEGKPNIYHEKKACEDEVPLSIGDKRFLKIYEKSIIDSKVYAKSPEQDKEIMLADIEKFRKMLGKPYAILTTEEKQFVDWVKELEALSHSSLKKTLTAMIDGHLHFTIDIPKANSKSEKAQSEKAQSY